MPDDEAAVFGDIAMEAGSEDDAMDPGDVAAQAAIDAIAEKDSSAFRQAIQDLVSSFEVGGNEEVM